MDDDLKALICYGKWGNCCWTNWLDNYWLDDFEKGKEDYYSLKEDLGDCYQKEFDRSPNDPGLRIYLQHDGSDGWRGDWLKLSVYKHNNYRIDTTRCTINFWIDDDDFKSIDCPERYLWFNGEDT